MVVYRNVKQTVAAFLRFGFCFAFFARFDTTEFSVSAASLQNVSYRDAEIVRPSECTVLSVRSRSFPQLLLLLLVDFCVLLKE